MCVDWWTFFKLLSTHCYLLFIGSDIVSHTTGHIGQIGKKACDIMIQHKVMCNTLLLIPIIHKIMTHKMHTCLLSKQERIGFMMVIMEML